MLVAAGSCIEHHGAAGIPAVLGALRGVCRGVRSDRVIDVLARHAPTWLMQLPALVADDTLPRFSSAPRARRNRECCGSWRMRSRCRANSCDRLRHRGPAVGGHLHSRAPRGARAAQRAGPAHRRHERQTEPSKSDVLSRVVGELTVPARRRRWRWALTLKRSVATSRGVVGHPFQPPSRKIRAPRATRCS